MKKKTLILMTLFLLPLSVVMGQRKSHSTAEADTTVVVTRVDTVYKNATQYALDSLKYASQLKLETIKNERYQDSIVYAQLSPERLYVLQLKKNNMYYNTPEEKLLNGPLIPMSFFIIGIVALIWLLLWARERGKRREHEYRMAQLDKGLQEKIIIREVEKVEIPVEKCVYVHDDIKNASSEKGKEETQEPIYQKRYSDSSFLDYLRVGTKYRKRGVLFIAFGLVTMLFFLSMGSRSPWGLGFIPIFVGLAYLYLDFTSYGEPKKYRPSQPYQELHYDKKAFSQQEKKEAKEEKTPDTDAQREE